MSRYVAFLSGVIVGGRSMLPVEDLRQVFFSMGFGNINTFKAANNIIFDSNDTDQAGIEQRIQRELSAIAGSPIGVFVRTSEQIVGISRINPFKTVSLGGADPYVAFLSADPAQVPALPLESPKKDVRMFHIEGREAYYLAKKVKGKAEFPNDFVAQALGVKAASRSWEIVKGLADLPK